MNLQATTLPFSNIRLGQQADNAAILEFYASVPMDAGDILLRYERGPNFFDFLHGQGERGFVIIFEREGVGEKGQRAIGGVATISVRPCLVDGQETFVSYLADLRLSPQLERGPRLQFRKWYELLVSTAKENTDLGATGLMYSAILDKNQIAISSLVRKNGDVDYRPIHKYRGVAVLGRWPWMRLRKSKDVHKISNFADPQLISFLQACNANKSFGYLYPRELEFRLQNWPGLDRHPFYVVTDSSGSILACALPWKGNDSRRAVIERIPFKLKFAAGFLPLIEGRRIREADRLSSLYLTHLEFAHHLSARERGRCLQNILDAVFSAGIFSNQHSLQFIEHDVQPFLKHLRGYYMQCAPATIYRVASRSNDTFAIKNPLTALEIATL